MLGWFYLLFFALQVFLLIRSFRRKSGLGKLLILNIFSIVLACFTLWYFDTLPGYGMMPGFAFFPEVMYSLMAAVAFAVLLLVTFLCRLYQRKK